MVTSLNSKCGYRWLLLLAGIWLASACADELLYSGPTEEAGTEVGNAVNFRAMISGEADGADMNEAKFHEAATRGIPVPGTEYPDGESFGVLGYRLPKGTWQQTLTPDLMYNLRVTRNGNQYTSQDVVYWPAVPVRFFGYHPYATADNGITLSSSTYAGNPYLSFTVRDEATRQVDLLLAAPEAAPTPATAIFPFKHGLTRLSFEVKKTDQSGEVKIHSIALKNIVGVGIVSLVPQSNGQFSWTPSTLFEDVKEYRLATPATDGTEKGLIAPQQQDINSATYQDICSPGGALFLIPQQITAGRSLLVIQYTIDGEEHTQEVLLPATTTGSAGEWTSGKFIRYQLTINLQSDTEEIEISTAEAEANCILLNPVPQTKPSASFLEYSIPIQYANAFYSTPDFLPWNEGVSAIGHTDPWGVSVIWMDKANLLSIVKRSGQGAGNDSDGRFTVRIPVGNEGNALVGIYKDTNNNGAKDNNEPWFWSWHLWVTDYDPNHLKSPGSITLASAEGAWETENGYVHRYRDATSIPESEVSDNNGNYGTLDAWTPVTGLYAGKTIMDRNLGSISVDFPPLENNIPFESANEQQRKTPLHVLYYQYGRKDPFLSNAYRYQENGTALNTIDFRNLQVPLIYSIQNPEVYIHGRQSWAIDKPIGCYWYDPRHPATEERSATTGLKSLFDPCPAGWRLPVNGTWSDFSSITFRWEVTRLGRVYKPDNSTLDVFYPAEGFRAASTGQVAQTGFHGIYWTSSPIPHNDRDYCFRFASPYTNPFEGTFLLNVIRPSAAVYQTDSFSVRCVQE